MQKNKTWTVTFESLPETLDRFRALPEASMREPYYTAALFIPAMCLWAANKNEATEMINFLKGPAPLSNYDKQFISDRMSQNNKAGFLGLSYFAGASHKNDYTPSRPYTVIISDGPYSYQEQGYVSLWISSGGADNPRSVKMRQTKEETWCLWEFSSLLMDIRAPESSNPWA